MSSDEPLTLGLFTESEEVGPAAPPEGRQDGGETGASTVPGVEDAAGEADGVEVWTVSQVNRAVRSLLEGALAPLWVSGEVGGWKRARSGHCYFTLKDEEAQLRCVMFRTDARRLPTDPDEGMEVRAHGSLTLYEARGEYQLVVRKVEAAGAEGLWRLAFEKLRKKLDAEGLLAEERKRPVPSFPRSVGVVTSPTGAALRDVLSVIRRRAPWTRVLVRGCRVQGDGAAAEIAKALRLLAGSGRVDVVIVGRGGGSIEDLWAFNEEPVARAVAEAPVPVITAVGHEVDVTIADLVADLRAPTPSAAAEAAVQDGGALLESLRELPGRLSRALRGCLSRRRDRLGHLEDAIGDRMEGRIAVGSDRVKRSREALGSAVDRILERRRQRVAALAGKLEALSPLATLARGYAVPLSAEGHVLRRVSEFEVGEAFHLRVADGRVRAETLARTLESGGVDDPGRSTDGA